LWKTAHSSVVEGEAFFSGLADGALGRAFGFAFVCELLAVGSLVAVWALSTYAVAPDLIVALWYDDDLRVPVFATLALCVPGLASTMVLLHVVWGAGVELGLRLQGEPVRLSHALRYALYSCGWDLLTSPRGLCAAAFTRGPAQGFRDVRAAVRVPRIATRAFLTGARRLTDDQARRAVWTGAAITGALIVSAAIGLLFAAIVATLD
jgi:hypothetical protein